MSVVVRGPLFEKGVPRIVEKAILHESFTKFEERMKRGGRGLGAKRNTVTARRPRFLQMDMETTTRRPRTKGTSWQRKNVAIARSMARRVVRKTAERIASELS